MSTRTKGRGSRYRSRSLYYSRHRCIRVVLFNDDYTPMDFVVEVLEVFFNMDREKATKIMLTVHTQGKAVCGLFTRDVAETKAMQVNQYARESQHPLLCEIEKDS